MCILAIVSTNLWGRPSLGISVSPVAGLSHSVDRSFVLALRAKDFEVEAVG